MSTFRVIDKVRHNFVADPFYKQLLLADKAGRKEAQSVINDLLCTNLDSHQKSLYWVNVMLALDRQVNSVKKATVSPSLRQNWQN